MRNFTFSIRNKIILLMIFSIGISGFFLGAYFLPRIKPLLVEHHLVELEQNLERHKSVLETRIRAFEAGFLTFSKQASIVKVVETTENSGTFFEDFLRGNPNYISVAYIALGKDSRKQVLKAYRADDYSIYTDTGILPLADDPFIDTAGALEADAVQLSNVFWDAENGAVIRAAASVIDADSQLQGLIVAEYKVQGFLTQNFSADPNLYITDQQGFYLLRPGTGKKSASIAKAKIQDEFPETAAVLLPDNPVSSTVMFYPKLPQSVCIVFSRFNYSPHAPQLFLVLALSETEALLSAKADDSFRKLILLPLIIIIGCILLSYFAVLKLTAPLKKLVSASNELGSDFSTINFPTDSSDELAALAKSLEDMNKTIIKQNESLKNSELMSRSIMNNMSDALITLTEDGLVHTFNKAAEKLFAYDANDIKGQHVKTLIPELENIGIQSDVEFRGVNSNGSDFPLEVSITDMTLHYRKAEARKFFIVLCRNIEARKRGEQQLKRAGQLAIAAKEEAEKANMAKTQFLSRMSHEFRTPLNAILGFTQVLLMDDSVDDGDSLIKPVYDSGNRLLEMVNNVLDISSMETGEMSFVQETVELVSVLKEVHTKALELAKESGTEIQLSIKAGQEDIFISADRERVIQVLMNLVGNALNFNRNNEKIVLSLRLLNAESVGISVKDSGIGIDKENQSIIFNPFERLDAYEQGVDGIGVGLTIAKQLTEKMGGQIGVESAKEVGSRFFVIFPICEPDEKSLMMAKLKDRQIHLDLPTERSVKVLYIEDDNINLALMEKVLAKYDNIEFIPASNPVQGINSVRKMPPDLVLLDLHLPDIDGFEVFECLKNYPAMQAVPVIAITASKEKKDMDRAMELGFYAYIVKPVKSEELYRKISEALYYRHETIKRFLQEERRKGHDRRKGDRRKSP